MNASAFLFSKNRWISQLSIQAVDNKKVQLVLCFGDKVILQDAKVFSSVKKQFPSADIIMCSTAGEIYQDSVKGDSLVAVALQFDKTNTQSASVNISDFTNSYDAAVELAGKLPKEGLSYIMVFSDGRLVNGSKLVKGLNDASAKHVLVTGGLAGDDINFLSTLVGLNEQPVEGKIVAIGFYGTHITVTHGSGGSGDSFGLEKEITRSSDNILFEIENQNALELYKKYLGAEAKNLPGAALQFPLSLTVPGTTQSVIRTILYINEEQNSMVFSGDIPQGSKIRFTKTTDEKLITSAGMAAQQTLFNRDDKPVFALLISCVGRKLLLGTRATEEVAAVKNVLGNKALMAGFYSYGEISPSDDANECQLHNQTMTITSFYES